MGPSHAASKKENPKKPSNFSSPKQTIICLLVVTIFTEFFLFKPHCISHIATQDSTKPSTCNISFTTMASKNWVIFEDFFPAMMARLGNEGFVNELCNGFRLLMDEGKGLITLDSLKKNSAMLGLDGMSDEELLSMLKEGDLDGDEMLNQMEFCVLMFRLSPDLMNCSRRWLEEVLVYGI